MEDDHGRVIDLHVEVEAERAQFGEPIERFFDFTENETSSGVVFSYKTVVDDPHGDIGRHCVYMRGYSSKAEGCFIGHNSWGAENWKLVGIQNEPDR